MTLLWFHIPTAIMDRNLGANNAIVLDVPGSAGTRYQFGRKDPYPKNTNAIYNNLGVKISGSLIRSVSTSETTTFPYTVKNPTVFMTGGIYLPPKTEWYMPIWYRESQIKSVYDPCPPGWIVPKDPFLSDILKANQKYPNIGILLFVDGIPNSGSTAAWFPYDGLAVQGGSSFTGIQTSTPYGTGHYAYRMGDPIHANDGCFEGYLGSAEGVRCVQE